MSPAKTEAGRRLREIFRNRRHLYLSIVHPDENYTVIHPSWDGQPDSRGVLRKPVWDGLAKFAEEQRLDLCDWVDTLFSMAYLFDEVPTPHRLKDQRVVKATRSAREQLSQDIIHRTKSQISITLSELFQAQQFSALPKETVYKSVLVHPDLDASSVVRYVLSRRLGLNDLAKCFLFGAVRQFATNKQAYRDALEAYREFISELDSDKSNC